MATYGVGASLLSNDRLAYFKSQMSVRSEAAFLAPQLLEQVSILTKDLRAAIGELESLRHGLTQIELRLASALSSEGNCPTCDHADLRAAIAALHAIVQPR